MSRIVIPIEDEGYARGRMFSRNPDSGLKRISANVYLERPGRDENGALPLFSLKKSFPEATKRLEEQGANLEARLKDAVQIDFEIEDGELRLSEPENLVRGPMAACKIAVGLVQEGILSTSEALRRVNVADIRYLLLPSFEGTELRKALREKRLLTQAGQGNDYGAISGVVAFDSASAWRWQRQGKSVILLCEKLSYQHREALQAVSGLLIRTGSTLAASQFERPCVVTSELSLEDDGTARLSGTRLSPGDTVSFDSRTGQVFSGALELVPGQLTADAETLLQWGDDVRKIDIRANISTVEDVQHAVSFGAAGVGLCRIESLFQRPSRLPLFQAALREICLGVDESSEIQRELCVEIEQEAHDLFSAAPAEQFQSFTVRLLDAPLSQMMRHWRDHLELPAEYFEEPMLSWLQELNPMQGLRCGRLSILYPNLMRLQIRALLRAWDRAQGTNSSIKLQIMMPGVTDVQELRLLREVTSEIARAEGLNMPQLGSMLELPRACLMADVLCDEVDFLSFGTGDLTESTTGMSRYDSQLSFLPAYLELGIFPKSPFQSIDQQGVGALMQLAGERVRKKYPTFELGTCGAQAIEAESLEFCCRIGLNYVSVPTHHLPVARLAAAQAALRTDSSGPATSVS